MTHCLVDVCTSSHRRPSSHHTLNVKGENLTSTQGCTFSGNLALGVNFQKFSLIVNITDNLGTSVDLDETREGDEMMMMMMMNECALTWRES